MQDYRFLFAAIAIFTTVDYTNKRFPIGFYISLAQSAELKTDL